MREIKMFGPILILFSFLIPVDSIYYSHVDFRPLMIRRRLIWRQQLHFYDPQNWYPFQRFPCPKDKVVLPENYVTFVDHRLTISELVLPENGEIVISKESGAVEFLLDDEHNEILFEDSKNSQCSSDEPARTMFFKPGKKDRNSWFDPDNWYMTFDFDTSGPSSSSYQISNYATFHRQQTRSKLVSLIPDSERIPCRRDFVDFPTNGSWKVTIGTETQIIPMLGSLNIGTIYRFRTATFREFTSTFLGQMLFDIKGYNHMEVEPLSVACRASQCACGNDEPKHMKEICRERNKNCPLLNCHDPIKPQGFCCPICASSLKIKLNQAEENSSQIIYRLLSKHLDKLYTLNEREIQKVSLYVHWLYDGSIQVLISNINSDRKSYEKNPLLESNRFLEELYQTLINDDTYKITELIKQSSIEWIVSISLFNSTLFSIFLLVLLLGIIGFFIYSYHRRNRNDPAFTFVRFRSAASDIELELDNPGLADDGLPEQFQQSGLNTIMMASSRFKIPEFTIGKMITKSIGNIGIVGGIGSSVPMLRSQYDDHDGGYNFENPIFKLNVAETIESYTDLADNTIQ